MRTILHCDLNNFYASVECLRHPDLAAHPIAVTGDPAKRHGVVLAKNMPAKLCGVKTGDVIWQAKMKCPNLICVAPHYDDYVRLSEQVFEIYTQYTDMVEAFGPDECWLDVTGSKRLFGDGKTIADKIRAHVTKETGLTLSAGVSWNKIFAKLGSDLKKPDATSVISPDNFRQIVFPLPVGELFMVGRATESALAQFNVHTIGDLATTDEKILVKRFGINGSKLRRYARGEDDEPVRKYFQKRVPDSVGHGITASRDVITYEDLRVVVYFLSDMIAKRLRKGGFTASKISVDLRDCNLNHTTRQCALSYPSDSAETLAAAAFDLAKNTYRAGQDAPLRTVTISSFGLQDAFSARQLSFFAPEDPERGHRRGVAIDYIDRRFGRDTVRRALSMGQDFVYDKTDSEDFLPFKR